MQKITGLKGTRKVFVAGGTGLLGTNLVQRLSALGAEWRASCFSSPPPFSRERYGRFDFTDFKQCLLALEGMSDLLLCAGQTAGAKMMKENPAAAILPNLQITSNLLEAARICRVERVVFVSSGTVYQELDRPIREEDLDLNISPYSLYLGVGNVTRYLEQLCSFYHQTYGMKIGIVRPSNFYGPYDHFDETRSHVLPALIRRALKKENPFKVWGSSQVVRDFIFVEDAVEGILRVLENYCVCDPLNLGYGEGVTIGEAVQTALKVCGYDIQPEYNTSGPTSIPHRVLDMTKFEMKLGRLPKISLEEGLKKLTEWYLSSSAHPEEKTVSAPAVHGKNFLITGFKSGFGRCLYEQCGGQGFDRENAQAVLKNARKDGPGVIIHCAFNSTKAISSEQLSAYYNDNVFLTRELTALPHQKFIYISSVDIYPHSGKTHEEDETIRLDDVKGLYGITKLISEALIRDRCANHLILRCGAFLGAYSRKANLKSLLEDENPRLTLSADSVFNCILHSDAAAFIRFAIEEDLRGTYNVVSNESISLAGIAELLNKKPKYGDYCYHVENISNQKIASAFGAFRKSSREVILEFLGRSGKDPAVREAGRKRA